MTLPDIGSGLPEIVVRTAIVYLFLVVVLRLSGKREVGQLSILELIVILTSRTPSRTRWSARTRRSGAGSWPS